MSITTQDHHPARVPDTAICLECGYPLRGLPDDVCPECGNGFDPANLRTWADPGRMTPFKRLVLSEGRHPSRAYTYLVGAATLTVLAVFSPARTLEVLGVLLLIVAAWLPRSICRSIARSFYPKPAWPKVPPLQRAVLMGSIILLTLRLFVPGPVCNPLLWASVPSLRAKSAEMRRAKSPPQGSQWVGLLHFRSIQTIYDGRVRFDWLEGYNLVHDPDHVGPRRQTYLFPWSKDWCLKDWDMP